MSKYRKEVHDISIIQDPTICARKDCNQKPELSGAWITLGGKERLVYFCLTHKLKEIEDEELWRLGL